MTRKTPLVRLAWITALATLAPSVAGAADGPWALCGPPLTPAPLGDPAKRDDPDTPTEVDAGAVRYDQGRYVLTGGAVIRRADRKVTAERMEYRTDPERVSASGDVHYEEAGAVVTADEAEMNLDADTGRFSAVTYRVDAGHLQGSASRAERLGPKRSRYYDVSLSTCNPGEEVWLLHAGTVTIDREERQGTATNAWLSVADVPVFYSPWLRFPVGSERMTGLLAPSLGQSSSGGFQVATPWYWNIAPNRDATITPTYYSKRGLMLGGELRYLEPWAAGEVRGTYLPDDSAFGDDRWLVQQHHRFAVGRHFSGEVEQRRVSDDDYLDDFGTGFNDSDFTSSERNLESYARASWSTQDWQVTADAQDWQTIDPRVAPRDEPYARRPRLSFDYRPLITDLPLDVSFEAEAVDFDHPHPEQRVTGQRFDIKPRLALPLRSLAYHFEPALSWRYTSYQLDAPDGASRSPERSVPIYSLDTGLSFVRYTSWFGHDMTQTLEPRMFYLYVPERDQDDLPTFDTDASDLSYSQLFREERFSGPDRVGDANQLSLGVTSRLLDQNTGRNYLRFSAGQIFYFDDREVTLDGSDDTEERSDYFTELRLNLPLGLSSTINYSWDEADFGNHDLYSRVRWNNGGPLLLNVSYRDRSGEGRNPLEQAETSFALSVSPRWSVLGGWNQDLLEKETDERFIGLEYESCCYAIRAVYQATQDNAPGDNLENQILLQFALKGLGGLGDTIPQFFENAVPGYKARPGY
ncbi:LPS-assembly protein LptD [Arhodomonas aquaeolei]|uniref:LPS-assembly protein LptD n=1 Tax=Arhodomonas aquaeolei TaxID=2369 RepID=UPI000362DA1E|nr:LPS assembly protein LptD [Arhodomonas aquaeolei]